MNRGQALAGIEAAGPRVFTTADTNSRRRALRKTPRCLKKNRDFDRKGDAGYDH
jgi:hypothetical protein